MPCHLALLGVVEPRVVADVTGFQLHKQDGTRGAQLVPAGRDAPQPLLRAYSFLPGRLDGQPEPVGQPVPPAGERRVPRPAVGSTVSKRRT
jgi:hypothetical protein